MLSKITKTVSTMLSVTLCFGAINAQKVEKISTFNVGSLKDQNVKNVEVKTLQQSAGFEEYNLQNSNTGYYEEFVTLAQEKQINSLADLRLEGGSIVYGNCVSPNVDYIRFRTDTPLTIETLIQNTGRIVMRGGAFYDGILYGYMNSNEGASFLKIDSSTGLLIEEIYGAAPEPMFGMSYDYSQGIMYGVAPNVLYTINLETGERTEVTEIKGVGQLMTFAIDLAGNMYGIPYALPPSGNAGLYSINKETGEATLIGLTGKSVHIFAQSMTFDYNTGILYWAQASSISTDAHFMTINTETGEATSIAHIGRQISNIHIPYYENGCSGISNLEYQVQANNEILLTWTAEGNPVGYKIFDVLTEIATTSETQILLPRQKAGSHFYGVKAVYSDGCVSHNITIPPFILDFLGDENIAYGNIFFGLPRNYTRWDVENPGFRQPIAPNLPLECGEFYDGLLFGYTSKGIYLIIDAATGNLIEEIPGTCDLLFQDMAYDYSQNIMYGISFNNLYEIDLWSGIPTLVTPISGLTPDYILFTLAVNLEGEMFTVESEHPTATTSGRFYKINKTTGAATFVGFTGKGVDFTQSMGFDHNNNILYWAQIYSDTDANFMSIDTTTGKATLLYSSGNQVTGLHIPYYSSNSCGKVSNFTATVIENASNVPDDVQLKWTAAPGNPMYYMIYDSYLAIYFAYSTETEVLLTDQAPGKHIYRVEAVYSNGCNPTKTMVIANLPSKINNPPQMFSVIQITNCTVKLEWIEPIKDEISPNLLSYTLYDNNTPIVTLPCAYHFHNYTVPATDDYVFNIVANYDNGMQSMMISSRTISITCGAINNYSVSNLSVDIDYSTREASLSWFEPTEMLWDNMKIDEDDYGITIGYWSGSDNGLFIADDFYADKPWTIEYVRSRGFYRNSEAWAAAPKKFSVSIHANSINDEGYNVPGSEIYLNRAVSTFAVVDALPNNAETAFMYTWVIKLDVPVNLPEAGTYWVSVVPAYDVTVNNASDVFPHCIYALWGTVLRRGHNFCIKDEDLFDYTNYPQAADWFPYTALDPALNLTQTSIQFAVEKKPFVKYNVYMDGVLIEEAIEETSIITEGIDISQDHIFCIKTVNEDGVEGAAVCQTIDYYTCNTVGASAKVEINGDCNEAVITWSAAVGENTQFYRIVFEGEILADNIENTAAARRFVHQMNFEIGKTYSWEIYTLCNLAYSNPRTVTASCTSGIDRLLYNLVLYPNPATSTLTIEGAEIVKVEIYNMLGYIIDTYIGCINEIDVSDYMQGQYIFKLFDINNNIVNKLITIKK